WDGDLDVCVDLTGSSPLIDAIQRKRVKYEAKCAKIGYGFLPSYSLLWGIIEGCSDLIEANLKILCGLRPYGVGDFGWMVDFVPGLAVNDAAHRKRVKYKGKCSDIGYGFLPFSFSSLGELEKDAVTLLKRI
ncbi:hypothetical protein Tco_0637100, partial [Tanacetum coccineum]